MLPSVYSLNQSIALNYGLILKSFDELDDEVAMRKPTPTINCPNWMLGHLVIGRYHLAGLAGADAALSPWAELYARGSVFSPDKNYRKLSEIRQGWIEVSELINKSLPQLTEEYLAKKCPVDFPVEDKTMLGGLAFLTLHENYHVGQLGLIRKELGLSSLFD